MDYICFKDMHCGLRTVTGELFDKDKQMELGSWAWLTVYNILSGSQWIYAITLLQTKEKLSDIIFFTYLITNRYIYTGQQGQHLMYYCHDQAWYSPSNVHVKNIYCLVLHVSKCRDSWLQYKCILFCLCVCLGFVLFIFFSTKSSFQFLPCTGSARLFLQ